MTARPRPICYGCKKQRADLACAAFPEGIPKPILWSEADHRKPYEGDRGFLFEPTNKEASEYADELFGPLARH